MTESESVPRPINPDENLVWIDCEMTGLHPEVDALVEVAVLVTDAELNVLDEGIDIVIKPPQDAVDQMVEFVRTMHTNSGLIEEWDRGASIDDATQQVLAYIKKHCPNPRTALLSGNTIGQDKLFLSKEMPEVIEHLHYRVVDVSTIKELSRRWYPAAKRHAPEKTGNHRALGDIIDSINELRYFRAAVMVESPGPSNSEARQIRDGVDFYTP
ncbi:MAG: oligoribonuclease [Micrococcaceae bacterium]